MGRGKSLIRSIPEVARLTASQCGVLPARRGRGQCRAPSHSLAGNPGTRAGDSPKVMVELLVCGRLASSAPVGCARGGPGQPLVLLSSLRLVTIRVRYHDW